MDSRSDLDELKRRLSEAEDTIRAIRDGEVDALVVRGGSSDEIFTIEGDSASYHAFMEAMEPGAAALDGAGRVLYVNAAMRDMIGDASGDLQGQLLVDLLEPAAGQAVAALLAEAGSARSTRTFQLDSGPHPHHVQASAMPLRLGTVRGYALTLTDVTTRVRAEAAEQSERAARAVIASANEAVVVCSQDGIVTHANPAAEALSEGQLIGRAFADAVPLSLPGATGLVQGDDIVAMAVAGNGVQGIEAVTLRAGKQQDLLISAAPLRVAGERISGCVITLVDLTRLKAAEKQQVLLMRELDHRVKNTLALVQSISSRTLMSEDTLEGFQKAFNGRLQALAATHSLLSDNSWTDLTVRDIVAAELAPFVTLDGTRLTLSDLDRQITPRAAIALGLIIHELATNAVKYGSLSSPRGTVQVRLLATPGSSALEVEWRESGGPVVREPTRKGFGRTLITRSMQYSPHGGAAMRFEANGLVCVISIPGEDVIAEQPRSDAGRDG